MSTGIAGPLYAATIYEPACGDAISAPPLEQLTVYSCSCASDVVAFFAAPLAFASTPSCNSFGSVSTLAGSPYDHSGLTDGYGTNSLFTNPFGVALSLDGTIALVVSMRLGTRRPPLSYSCAHPTHARPDLQADSSSQAIRRIVVSSAQVTTIAGARGANAASGVGCADGAGRTVALFNSPSGLAMDAAQTFAVIVR